ncbi:hypothetical protein [Fonticella tunisiensis]|uniref:Uncharacterized protein n=1 Tax=Fonticella tunisiensis TaxID=1096341 RepID=A0A4R7KTN2_9CLOT|nr:hypothetical protein [Fonticella tunisiensis]TDT63373.1 hypothetical protein EDD71_102133 [Fonticella tunisiensis]
MKKLALILVLVMSIFFTACPGPEEEGEKGEGTNNVQTKEINMQSAKEFMDNYMRYVIKMDMDVMRSFYTKRFREQIKDIPKTNNPHPIGYSVGEGENKGENGEFTVKIFNGSTGSPYYSSDTYKYKIVMEDGKMLIDDITKEKEVEVYGKGKNLLMKEGGDVEERYILSVDELPSYASPLASPERKLAVSKDGLGPCALSPDERSIVITSTGKNSLVVTGEFQEAESAMKQQEGDKKTGGKEDKKGGKGEEENGGKEEDKEEKQDIDKNILQKAEVKLNPVDVYVDAKINTITFSPDGKIFAVQIAPVGGLDQIKLYRSDKGEPIKTYKINTNFRSDRFSLTNPYFTSPEALSFTVTAVSGAQAEESALEGEWSYDIKSDNLKKTR